MDSNQHFLHVCKDRPYFVLHLKMDGHTKHTKLRQSPHSHISHIPECTSLSNICNVAMLISLITLHPLLLITTEASVIMCGQRKWSM